MLSRHDRATLAEMERHLRGTDPQLARMLETAQPAAPLTRVFHRTVRSVGLAGLALGVLLFVTAIVSHSADVAVVAAIILLADAAYTALRWARRHRDRSR